MIKIVEWLERYEVSSKGREPKPGDELRAGPLQFIRLKVYGHTQSTGYRRLKSVAGDRMMEVFGIFCKFLEIAGNQKREQRGVLLNEKNQPATAEDLAFILDVPIEQIVNAIKVLSDKKVGWIIYKKESIKERNKHNTTQLNSTQRSPEIPENPEISGKDDKFSHDSNEYKLSKLLLDLILERKPDFREGQPAHQEKTLQRWLRYIDYMIRLDDRRPENIESVIHWCQRDNFWQNIILSTKKLREKFDQLELKMKENRHGSHKVSREFTEDSAIGETIQA